MTSENRGGKRTGAGRPTKPENEKPSMSQLTALYLFVRFNINETER